MNPEQVNRFAEAYVPEVLAAAREFRYYLQPGEVVEQFALTTALEMLTIIQRDGVAAVEHYHINQQGGAFARACTTLGISNTRASISNFLEG